MYHKLLSQACTLSMVGLVVDGLNALLPLRARALDQLLSLANVLPMLPQEPLRTIHDTFRYAPCMTSYARGCQSPVAMHSACDGAHTLALASSESGWSSSTSTARCGSSSSDEWYSVVFLSSAVKDTLRFALLASARAISSHRTRLRAPGVEDT